MKSKLKIKAYTPREIAAITGGELVLCGGADADREIRSVCTDSREVTEGTLFCALRGERTDGHKYIQAAAALGAGCILAETLPEEAESCGCAVVLVQNTVFAVGELARDYRDCADVRVIAVTGSVGKTTTKEFIAAVASAGFKTHKTAGNHNSDIGLPMTLFSLGADDQVSVLEMGMSALGEIERMSQIARPDIALVTNIGTSHLASLGSRENICRAKLEITAGMKEDGILLLNADEPLLYEQIPHIKTKVQLLSIVSHYGDYRAVNIRALEDGMMYDMICRDQALTNIVIPALGRHNVYNSLSAYAVGYLLGMEDEEIRRGLKAFVGAEMRQKIYELHGNTIIEDCYNASPESMRAALDVLTSVARKKEGNPCALLGDMLELGDDSRFLHYQLGQHAAQSHVQKLFCYGHMADVIAEAAIVHGIRADNVFVSLDSDDPQTMADMLLDNLEAGDILLVKASRGVAAENVLECMKHRRRRKGHQS